MTCPACGSEQTGKYCGNCGSALPAAIREIQAATEAEVAAGAVAAVEVPVSAAVNPLPEVEVPASTQAGNPQDDGGMPAVAFGSRNTLLYMLGSLILFGYTCIQYWS